MDARAETHVYAHAGDTPLELDLYRPAGIAQPPVALYLHGGGWAGGTRADRIAERVAPVVAERVAIASVTYRLTDVARWPAQVEDVQAAVRFLRANAADLGVRGQAIGAWGASAGGHLALMAALAAGPEDDASVQTVVAFFPPTDLLAQGAFVPGSDAPLPPFLSGPLPSPGFETRLLGAPPADVPERAQAASPVHRIAGAGATRFLLVHGDRDGLIPVEQSRRMHDALREAGADAALLVVAGANHEDPAFDRPEVLGAVAGFLRATI